MAAFEFKEATGAVRLFAHKKVIFLNNNLPQLSFEIYQAQLEEVDLVLYFYRTSEQCF